MGQTTDKTTPLIESIIEQIAQQRDEPQDYSSLLNDLVTLIQNPLDLNKANREDLQKLYLLNPIMIDNILEYRESNGPFYTIYELQLIPGFSPDLIHMIAPMLTIIHKPITPYKSLPHTRPKHQILLRTQRILQKMEGYKVYPENSPNFLSKQPSRFEGNPWRYYSRYSYTSAQGHLKMGITTEKDPGEAFLQKNRNKGFDFNSIFLQWTPSKGKLMQLTVGDYMLKFGQGLCVWSDLAQNKSSQTVNQSRTSQGIHPYRSTNENSYLRGVATQWRITSTLQLYTFFSHKNRDANIAQPDISKDLPLRAISLPNTGLHRNQLEWQKRHRLTENLWGVNTEWNTNKFKAGVTFLTYDYSHPLIPPPQPYNNKDFSGSSNYNLGAHYQLHFRKLHIFGEMAMSKSHGKAIIQGLQAQANAKLQFQLLYRKYEPNYHTLYANAFAEQSSPKNEEGFYMGLLFHPFIKWNISAYWDHYRFPWLRYQTRAPGNGNDMFTQIQFLPNRNTDLSFRFKREKTLENLTSLYGVTDSQETIRQQFRFHIIYHPLIRWEFRNRLEVSTYKKEEKHEKGYLLYHDIVYRHMETPLTIYFRMALFHTDSYQSRIYAYENDVLYAFSIPAYFNKGTRTYLTLRYPISKKADIYLRYAQTHYQDVNHIGSGTSSIKGDTKSEIKFQIRLRL